MKILILSQHYPPEPNTRLRDLTRHLAAQGHDVSVLTTFPSYPLGKVYDGYRLAPYTRHRELGVTVRRVFAVPYRGLSAGKRMLSYGSFAVMSLLLGLLPGRRPDVMYVYHPPLTTGLAAAIYNLVAGVPFVYDVQDLWPDAIVAAGLLREKSAAYHAIRMVENFVYRRASRITVLSEGMKSNLLNKGVPASKIAVISNWGDPNTYSPMDSQSLRQQLGWQGKIVFMLAGNMGLTHGLETVIEAAALLQDNPNILFAFVGSGTAKDGLVRQVEERGLRNVLFMGQVPPEEAARLINAADAMLVHLKPAMGGDFSVPHRIFSYMLCARPVVAAATGSTSELVRSLDCGWVCPPSDTQSLARLLAQVAADPDARHSKGQNGLAAARGPYSRAHFLGQLERLIVAANRRRNSQPTSPLGHYRVVKRILDIVMAGVALVMLSPIIALIALAVRLTLGSPVLFRQVRPGHRGRPFTVLKFRTMKEVHDVSGNPLPDAARLTRFGHFLRSTSLDELPELLNVLKGEMSIVGPRPLLMRYLERYTPEQMRRHDVKPGITGWAQVNGRNTLSWERKFEMDLWYVEHQSLNLDLKIIGMTIGKMLRREGISQSGEATAQEFMGSTV
ncbi:MAG TPA: sugar transferase [Chloroflexia bacterium]|nr:sugar transferase [Chloroflexia bacterium]